MRNRTAYILLAAMTVLSLSGFPASGAELPGKIAASALLPSLSQAYEEHFMIGTAFSRADLSGARFDLVTRHFNVLTAENAMKPSSLSDAGGRFRFENPDRMLDTILDAGIAVHGHTLVWHSQSARWLNAPGTTREEAAANLEAYITAVAGHYAGRVISWDVVNEAFQVSVGEPPRDWRDALRKGGDGGESSLWYQAYENGADTAAGESGADYIYDAFVSARKADPGAVLYYNDFNEESRGKREAIAMMTEELNEKWRSDPRNTQPDRLLIEGLGMQGHYWTDHLVPSQVEETIIRWTATGAEISVSELDIPAGSWRGFKELDEETEKRQAELYARLFEIYKRHSGNISRVTFWGIEDPRSWRSEGHPLLFDADGAPKYAFYAVLDPEGYLAGDYDGVKDAPAETRRRNHMIIIGVCAAFVITGTLITLIRKTGSKYRR